MEKAFYQILFYLIIAVIIIYFSTRKRKKPAQTQLTSQNASSDSQGDLSKRVDELLDRIDKELSSYKKVGGGEQTDNSLDTPFSTLDNA
ncbi:MAG: hypothetical protein N2Z72_03040, partial [Bacteroidales bacterium]|nr:hypothetical protein [Bacteroidales bacterium]